MPEFDTAPLSLDSVDDFPVPFPQIGKPSVLDPSGEFFVSENSATPVESGSEEDLKDLLGYTSPNLHRRIQDDLIETTSFSSNVTKGQTFTLDPAVDILICEYGSNTEWQELRLGKDYSRISNNSIKLLDSSQIIPSSVNPTKELRITYSNRDTGHSCDIQLTTQELEDNNIKLGAMKPNNYNLEIRSVDSYRTTTVHLHDDNLRGGPGSGENEIP